MIPVALPSSRYPAEVSAGTHADFGALRKECDRTAVQRELALLGLGGDDPALLLGELFRSIAARYTRMLQTFPGDSRLVLALVRRLEIDNVRLAWRAVGAGLDEAKWTPWWRPLGEVASVAVDDVRAAGTLGHLTKILASTPYGHVAEAALRAWSYDVAEADPLFELWAWRALRGEVDRGTEDEPLLREILMSMILERDVALLRFCAGEGGLARRTVTLHEDIGAEAFSALSGWSGSPALCEVLPTGVVEDPRGISDWDDLLARIGNERRMSCLRARFLHKRDLGAAMASLVLEEEDVGRLVAAVESGAEDDLGRTSASERLDAVRGARGGV